MVELEADSLEEDTFPSGIVGKSCGCSNKATKATTAGVKDKISHTKSGKEFCSKNLGCKEGCFLDVATKPLTINTVKTKSSKGCSTSSKKSLPGNLATKEAISKTFCSSNSVKSGEISSKTTQSSSIRFPKKTHSEGSKSVDLSSKLCYCKSCQTEPDQPCAPNECTTKVDKAQLARVTRKPPTKPTPKVHTSIQTEKSKKRNCCKWLKSTFRSTKSTCKVGNECSCASKGCCNKELCDQINVKEKESTK